MRREGTLPLLVDRDRCVAAFGAWWGETLKHHDDLRRYATILEATKPDVIVEVGRYNGASARWLREYAPVVSVDTVEAGPGDWDGITCLTGNSVSEAVVDAVWAHVDDRRATVILDSDHSTLHVLREIILYGSLVGTDCHLVVEDGVLAWLSHATLTRHTCWYEGNPLQAIHRAHSGGFLDGFTRDAQIEVFDGAPTMHPAGFWKAKAWSR